MTQRFALVAAAALAAFVLVLMGALGAYMLADGPAIVAASAAANQQQAVTAPAPAQQAPALPSEGQGQTSGDQGNQGNANSDNNYPVSADQAASIALSVAQGASVVQQPTLVNLRGTVAYEVVLNTGYVYVDATSGQVLFNGAGNPRRHRFNR